MSEECQGNPKKQTYLLECRPYVDYISKKVCIADPMQTMQTVFVTLVDPAADKADPETEYLGWSCACHDRVLSSCQGGQEDGDSL